MRRILIVLAATVVAALGTAGAASASGSAAKLQLRKTSVGTILVDSRGATLYAFTKDGRNVDTCVRIGGCAGLWPLLTTAGKPVAGTGVRASLIGTIAVRAGARQVTYAGHPLYSYSGDSGPGQVSYVGVAQFGGSWPAVNAAGGEVK